MNTNIESRRITFFLLFSFGIAWVLALGIDLTGGLTNLTPGTIAWLLMVLAMFSPAIANVLTRWITKESLKETYLKVNLKQNKRYLLIAWFGTPVLLLLGMVIYFVLFPSYFDRSFSGMSKILAQAAQQTGKAIPLSPQLFLAVQIIQAIVLAPIINSVATFGEEFGWRAYLLEKVMPLGGRKALLIMGVIWGIWHWPFIYMGYEYGFDYPGYPWLGPIVFLWFTFTVGIFLAWLTLKSKSIWPAVIAHAALNGMAPLALLLVKGQPNPLLGPAAVGLVASIPFTILGLALFLRSEIFSSTEVLPGKSDVVQHPAI
jgi:membrane protease YdiL (CAAX protease family)